MQHEGEDILQNANGADDYGGKCFLFRGVTDHGPWILDREVEWARVVTWGSGGQWEGFFLTAVERGNGLAYVGNSLDSNVVFWQS